MSEIKRIGIDTSKAVFTLHAIDQADRPALRVNLRRAQMLPFFKKRPEPRSPWKPAAARTTGRASSLPWVMTCV
jgi:hypothetical protein